MEFLFKKKLTKSELEYRGVHLTKKFSKYLPEGNFDIKVGEVLLNKRVDKYARMFLNVKNYAEIGDILAQIPASTYEKLFAKIEDVELVKRLATILKDHTPEEEEFAPLHAVLQMYTE